MLKVIGSLLILTLYCIMVIIYSMRPNNSALMVILMGSSLIVAAVITLRFLQSDKKTK